jgi:hypothetical protein
MSRHANPTSRTDDLLPVAQFLATFLPLRELLLGVPPLQGRVLGFFGPLVGFDLTSTSPRNSCVAVTRPQPSVRTSFRTKCTHVRVDDVRVANPAATRGFATWIGHIPMSREAFDRSVLDLVGTTTQEPDLEGYQVSNDEGDGVITAPGVGASPPGQVSSSSAA